MNLNFGKALRNGLLKEFLDNSTIEERLEIRDEAFKTYKESFGIDALSLLNDEDKAIVNDPDTFPLERVAIMGQAYVDHMDKLDEEGYALGVKETLYEEPVIRILDDKPRTLRDRCQEIHDLGARCRDINSYVAIKLVNISEIVLPNDTKKKH